MSILESLLGALGGGNFSDIEKNAGDLLTRLEKLGGDVIASNGNVVAAVVAVAEDFATLKQVVSDVRAIVDDLKALHAAAAGTPSPGIPVPPAPSPVSVTSILQAAAAATTALTGVSDPFAAKPLAHTASVNEPQGGA